MTTLPCPLPQVEEALAPYIHSRQETRRIRQSIAQHLAASIEPGTQGPLLFTCPPPSVSIDEQPIGLGGLYTRYYDALRANIAARESYEQLKRELEEAREHTTTTKPRSSHLNGIEAPVQSYIKLQRQRQQNAKLQILQETLGKLTDEAPRALQSDLGTLLKEELGEAPDPPKSSLSAGASGVHVDELIFKLKRELLLTKNSMDQAMRSRAELHEQMKSMVEPSAEAQIYALQSARDQLIAWIEAELAKISENEGDSSIVEADPDVTSPTEIPSNEVVTAQIQALYDKYVVSRKELVQSVNAAVAATKEQSTPAPSSRKPPALVRSQSTPTAETLKYADLMSCVPSLVQAARSERSLIQQASYLRRQLATASDDTRATIQRLAGESYLVGPDATNIEAWAAAASSKAGETDAFVKEQVAAGKLCIVATKENLSRVEAKKTAMDVLKGDL